jgi:hypothetical protein
MGQQIAQGRPTIWPQIVAKREKGDEGMIERVALAR